MNRLLTYTLICCLVLSLGGCSAAETPIPADKESAANHTVEIPYGDEVRWTVEKSLESEKSLLWSDKSISGAVLPHHLLMAPWIAQAFNSLKSLNPDIIVVISPNHSQIIKEPVYSTSASLVTYRGKMPVSAVTRVLEAKGLAVLSDSVISQEYGLTNLLPYIQNAGWQGELIPLVLARKTPTSQLDDILKTIEKAGEGKRIFYIASIDFSHGLKAIDSRKRDDETMEWIRKRDYDSILSSGPENLDNPSGLYLWLHAMASEKLVYHGESGSLSGDRLNEAGTSYLFYTGSATN